MEGTPPRGVVASLRTFQGTSGTAVVRSQRYRVEHGIKRQVFPGGFRLPFGLDADGEVELARIFHSEEDAEQSSPLTLLDIPFDATSAKALPEGSVVSLPIRTRLATDVNGSFLSKGIHHSSNLLPA